MAKKKVVEKPIIVENIVHSAMDELMGERFDIYAKDVIQDRAIPDARDGLKPVQRRIIYAMWNTNNTIDKPTKKCAHIVGEVMGKYHPHGDSSIYEALVRMSQPWNLRAPLIDFQGNNGSMDGDGPAAYRYTEARLSALSNELIRDIEKDTVRMGLTFDDANYEPLVLPSRFPNMFVNGAKGIAVGMATEIPPHNLGEITRAVIHRIEHPSCPIESLMKFVAGPDFPTGGVIYNSQGLSDIYLTGKGKIEMQCKYHIEENDGVNSIIITEIPYQVVKSSLVFSIDKIRHDKDIDGIDEVRDETDKNGVRIAIDLKPNFKPKAIIAYLMSKTDMRTSYTANMVAIVDGRPATLDLLSYCDTYIAHQREVITRRSIFLRKKDIARLEIVDGLIKANSVIDEVVHIIRASADKADARKNLEARFGFTENQSEAIVMMPLYKLSHTDIVSLEEEAKALRDDIAYLDGILKSQEALDKVIVADLREIMKKYDSPRRTVIEEEDETLREVKRAELIASEEVMVAVSRDGYVKRSSLASYKGSGGHNGVLPGCKEKDTLVFIGPAQTTDHMLMFTSKGNYLYVPVHLLKSNKWNDEGVHVNIAVNLDADDKIIKAFAVETFREGINVVIASKNGQIKRTKLSAFPVTRFTRPVKAMKLFADDELADVVFTSGNDNLLVISSSGGKDETVLASFYNENEISITGTSSSGMKAASFKGKPVAALIAFNPEERGKVMLLTDHGVTRVFGINNIEEGTRTGKATILYRYFKKEENGLVYAQKAQNVEVPKTFKVTLDDGSYAEVVYEDLLLTPMDKYAKSEKELPKGRTIVSVFRGDSMRIDDSFKTFESPKGEGDEGEEIPAPTESSDSEPNQLLEGNEEGDNEGPVELFEQMSIFGDDDF